MAAKVKQKLNIRERKMVKGIAEGLSANEAMRRAGYSDAYSKGHAKKKVEDIAPTIQELMDKKGLTDDRLLDVLDEGLRATKVISCNVIAPNGEGMADAHGTTKDFIDVEDYATRHKYLTTGLQIKGHLIERRDDTIRGVIVMKPAPITKPKNSGLSGSE